MVKLLKRIGEKRKTTICFYMEQRRWLVHKTVMEKSDGITAIPHLFEIIQIKCNIVTIDVIGTQTAIGEKI